MIETADALRALAILEQPDFDVVNWTDSKDLSHELIDWLGTQSVTAFLVKFKRGVPFEDAVYDGALNGFMIGWELAMEFGKRIEVKE